MPKQKNIEREINAAIRKEQKELEGVEAAMKIGLEGELCQCNPSRLPIVRNPIELKYKYCEKHKTIYIYIP